MTPMAMVMPAVMIDATAMMVMLSMDFPLLFLVMGVSRRGFCIDPWLANARRGGDVDGSQNAENVGLHHAGQQAEQGYEDRETNRVMVSRMAMIIEPLIMLPNRRTASARVREISLMMLNGSMITVGSM